MQPFTRRVPPFFQGGDAPAIISMLVGQTELAPPAPNVLLICSQDLPLSLSLPAVPEMVPAKRKRSKSISRSHTPAVTRSPSITRERTPSRTRSRSAERAPVPKRNRSTSPPKKVHMTRATTSPSPAPSPRSKRGGSVKKQVTIKSPSVSPLSDLSESSGGSGDDTEGEGDEDEDGEEDEDEDEDEDDEDGDTLGKIAKPAGEPGRPGRGGYNLEAALGWGEKAYNQFKTKVDRLIKTHLDQGLSYAKQDQKSVRYLINEAVNLMPELNKYEDHWPLTDLLKLRLKYFASRKAKKPKKAKPAKK
ncbi:hypothetical protein BDW22DRAFT_1432153 [Trametopsis cervina]|nr:hypothetical protein BDW22DRAFT_1432153 [Trametopsis cervina]